jgi:hypothetical protein
MKLYAETPVRRARQVAGDLFVLLWIAGWTRVGVFVHDLVEKLAGPGESVEDAGRSFAGSVGRLGRNADDLPLVGDRLRSGFETVADGGRALQRAGQAQQDAVHTLAFWLGLLLALLPILWLVGRYVPGRVAWIREATAASRLRVAPGLFALRALAHRPLTELARVSADPVADYHAGKFEGLARLELEALGLRWRVPSSSISTG